MTSENNDDKGLTGFEEREVGAISWDVISRYISCAGGRLTILLMVLLLVLEQGVKIFADRWIGLWVSDSYDKSLGFYLGVYSGLGMAFALAVLVRWGCHSLFSVTCGSEGRTSMHTKLRQCSILAVLLDTVLSNCALDME